MGAPEAIGILRGDDEAYYTPSMLAEAKKMGAEALEAWAWVERNKAMVSWQNGAWHCAVGLCTHAINGTVLAAVLDAMAKEGKG